MRGGCGCGLDGWPAGYWIGMEWNGIKRRRRWCV